MTTFYSKSISTPGPQPASQQDSKHIAPQSGRVRNDSDKKKRKVITIGSRSLLNFDNFIHTDMSLFQVKVISVEKHVFSPEAYIVEIRISSIPPFKVQKICEEFRTFHRALTLRFPNVNWPEFPSSFLIITGKKSETRTKAFNEILNRICEVARLEDGSKRSILSIFYAFFLETGISAGPITPEIKTRGHAESFTSADSGKRDSRFEADSNESEKGHTLKHANTFSAGKKSSADDSLKPDLNRGATSVSNEKYNKATFSFSTDHEMPEFNAKESFEVPGSDVKKVMSLGHIGEDYRDWKRSKSCDDCKSIMDNEMFTNLMGNPFVNANAQELLHKSEENTRRRYTEGGQSKKIKRRNSETVKKRDNFENLTGPSPKGSFLGQSQTKRSNLRPKGRTVVDSKKEAERVVKFNEDKQNSGLSAELWTSQEKKPAIRKLSKEENEEEKVELNKTKEEELVEKRIARKKSRELILPDDISNVKEIVGFNGAIFAKLSTESIWNKYFARISDCSLHLYQSILDHFPVHVVPCYHSVVDYVDLPTEEYLEVFHFYDADKMQICIDPQSEDQNADLTPNSARNLATWYTQIKIASQKVTGLNISEENYQPIGKLQLIITSASNVKGLPKNSTCYVRISHTPYVLQTGKSLMGETMKWKQSFFVPICDTFFPITLELVCAYNNGWVKESLTEEVICTSEIVVPDVLSLRSNTVLSMNLAFKYPENKRKQILKSSGLADQDLHDPIMRIKVKNLSTMKSYFAPQYGDFVEGVKFDSQKFVRQLFKLSIHRMKRVVASVILMIRDFNTIYQFKYPFFSSLCFFLFTWIAMTLDASNFLAEFLLVVTIFCLYKHPQVEAKVKPFLTRRFFKEEDLNPFYKPCLVNTQGDLTLKKYMRTAHWKFRLKDEDTLMTQLQMAKKSIIVITRILTKISGFCEKIKNLVFWDDPYRSAWFVLMTAIGYCVVSVVPIRMAILFGIWAKFIRGVDHYRSLYLKNREVAIHTLSFILSKHFPDHKKFIMENLSMPWPTTLSLNNFQKKLIEHFKIRIEVVLSTEDFAHIKTPEDLISRLETCHKLLKFKRDALEEASLHMYKPEAPKLKPRSILHFIMNVPSDYYRVIHPKMNIRQKHVTH